MAETGYLTSEDILILKFVVLHFSKVRQDIFDKGYWHNIEGKKLLVSDNEGYAPTYLNGLIASAQVLVKEHTME